MSKLIIMPAMKLLMSHHHLADNHLTHNGMALTMPPHTSETMNFLDDLVLVHGIWGERLANARVEGFQLKRAFWNMRDMREWVDATLDDTLYLVPNAAAVHFSATEDDLTRVLERVKQPKNHTVVMNVHRAHADDVSNWIRDNVTGEHEVLIAGVVNNMVPVTTHFRDEGDAALFKIRWMGHESNVGA